MASADGTSSSRKRKSSEVSSRDAGTYERRKAQNACLVCRARKTKCDNELPVCSFCKATGGECRYAKPNSLRYDQATLAILERIEKLESSLGPVISAYDQSQGPQLATRASFRTNVEPGPRAEARVSRKPDQVALDTHRIDDVEGPPSSSILLQASSEMSIEAMLLWPIFEHHLFRLPSQPLIRDLDSVAHRRNSRSDRSKIDRLNLDLPTVHNLVQGFVANILPSNPVLNPSTLRHDVQGALDDGMKPSGRTCLVLLVLALGSISNSTRQSLVDRHIDVSVNDPEYRAAEEYFWASQTSIGTLFHEDHLLSAQCAFFTAVYLSFTLRILPAWKAFAQAGTQCLAHLSSRGLLDHNSGIMCTPGSQDGISEQRVLEDSLYWVILKGEAELCLELGLPASGLHECPYPHIFPQPPDLEDLASSADFPPSDTQGGDHRHFLTGWFYYLGEIALKRLQNRVLEKGFFRQKPTNPQHVSTKEQILGLVHTVRDFDNQLNQWLQSLPELLQFSATEPEYLQDHLRWVLRGHRLDVVELLRFPAIKTVLNASPSEVGTLPDDITRLAREYLDNAVLRIDIHVEEFLHRHQGTWLTIRGCTRSILALIGMKLKCQQVAEHVVGLPDGRQGSHTHDPSFQSRLLPKNWRTAVVRVDDMLFAWETESTDVARLRLIVQTLLGLCYEDRDSD